MQLFSVLNNITGLVFLPLIWLMLKLRVFWGVYIHCQDTIIGL